MEVFEVVVVVMGLMKVFLSLVCNCLYMFCLFD